MHSAAANLLQTSGFGKIQRAGKSFDLQVGPDQGHSALNQQRMMEFFIEAMAH